MKTEKFSASTLKHHLTSSKICTLGEMMKVLGTGARKTVFRKLAELNYQTSYSHAGKYYALKSVCRFNDKGLWSFNEVWFSVHGTLLKTIMEFINGSERGFSAEELCRILHVSSKQALFNLESKGLLYRQKFSGVYIYFSDNHKIRRPQVEARKFEIFGTSNVTGQGELLAHELKAAIVLFFSLLDERQRRLFAGIEALKLGKGGDTHIAEFLSIDPHTVAKGRRELLNRDIHIERLRQPGAGRKRQEKKHQK